MENCTATKQNKQQKTPNLQTDERAEIKRNLWYNNQIILCCFSLKTEVSGFEIAPLEKGFSEQDLQFISLDTDLSNNQQNCKNEDNCNSHTVDVIVSAAPENGATKLT